MVTPVKSSPVQPPVTSETAHPSASMSGGAGGNSARPASQLNTPAGIPPRRHTETAHVDSSRPRVPSGHIELQRLDTETQSLHSPAGRSFGSRRHLQHPHAHSHPHGSSQGTSPLLPHPTLGRSDHFSIDMSTAGSVSGRSDLFEIDLDAPEQVATPGDDVVIDIDPPPPPLTPRAQIEQALAGYEFAAPPGPERDAQIALELDYVNWAAGVADQRQAAFGDGGYSVGQDHATKFGEAVVPALYDGARQFISSSARSPFQGATMTGLAPRHEQVGGLRINHGELDNQYDTAVIGGAVGGLVAYAVDSTVLKAMDKRADLANLPKLKAVDLKTLQLRVVDGRME